MSNDPLRSLIRLIPPARALKEELEKRLHLEIYEGTGEMAARNYEGLHRAVAALSDSPYVESLTLDRPAKASDKQLVSLVHLAASQLLAYLEGETGLVGWGGRGNGTNIQTAPVMNISGLQGAPPEFLRRIAEIASDRWGDKRQGD